MSGGPSPGLADIAREARERDGMEAAKYLAREGHPLAGDVHRHQEQGASPTIDYLDSLLIRLRDAGVYHYSDGRITLDIERKQHAPASPYREDYKGKV